MCDRVTVVLGDIAFTLSSRKTNDHVYDFAFGIEDPLLFTECDAMITPQSRLLYMTYIQECNGNGTLRFAIDDCDVEIRANCDGLSVVLSKTHIYDIKGVLTRNTLFL